MGMDVYGKSGNYFRASVWSWRPICAVMEAAGFNVPNVWHYNDGAGLESAKDCQELADLIERYIAKNPSRNYELASDMELDMMQPDGTVVKRNPYAVDRGHLLEFVEFLRECGAGFEIQ